jgi:hypothetical protein
MSIKSAMAAKISIKSPVCRLIVHDCASSPQNSPSLLEFECLTDPAKLRNEKRLKAALICCAWDAYRKVKFPEGVKVFDPWGVPP